MYVYWPEERLPCLVCMAPVHVIVMGRGELYAEGPQGGLGCQEGHTRWVWPRECRVAASEEQAIRPEQLLLLPW